MARLIGRKANGVNSVSVAGVLLLLWRPFLFWDIGFRLSVLSALTIAMMPRRKITWLIISTVVFLVTFPQVAYTFRSVPAVGVILNTVAPYYFFVAFSVASCAAFLRLIHIPFMKYILLAVEGGFMLWEKQAETACPPVHQLELLYRVDWGGSVHVLDLQIFRILLRKNTGSNDCRESCGVHDVFVRHKKEPSVWKTLYALVDWL